MSDLAEQIAQAQRAVDNWPADVKAAMGLEPTPSARIAELERALEAKDAELATYNRLLREVVADSERRIAECGSGPVNVINGCLDCDRDREQIARARQLLEGKS